MDVAVADDVGGRRVRRRRVRAGEVGVVNEGAELVLGAGTNTRCELAHRRRVEEADAAGRSSPARGRWAASPSQCQLVRRRAGRAPTGRAPTAARRRGDERRPSCPGPSTSHALPRQPDALGPARALADDVAEVDDLVMPRASMSASTASSAVRLPWTSEMTATRSSRQRQGSVLVGLAGQGEHLVERDPGLGGDGRVDADRVDDAARRRATRAPTRGAAGRSGSSSSSSRRSSPGTRSAAPGMLAPAGARG